MLNVKTTGLRGMLFGAVAIAPLLAGGASAQEANAVDEVVVTATRLNQAGFEAPTPTTVVGSADIARVAPVNLQALVNQIPIARASLTSSSSANESAGIAGSYLDLRGLGTQRTLVLFDGQRFVPTRTSGGLNISILPQAVIGSVDIVSGGASAAWGSDAVAGVVNFKTLTSLEGFKATLQGGASTHGDADTLLVSLAYGTKFAEGRGQILLAAERAEKGGVNFDARGYAADGYNLIANPASTAANGLPLRLQVPMARASNRAPGGVINAGPLRGLLFLGGGATRPFDFGTLTSATTQMGGDGAEITRVDIDAPEDRSTFYGRVSYELTPTLRATLSGSYAESESSFLMNNATPSDASITIRADNAFLPASVRASMATAGVQTFTMGRSNFDYAIGTKTIVNETARVVFGLEGDLGGGWSWDAYATYGKTKNDFEISNFRVTSRFNLAVDAVLSPAGTAVCRSTLTDPTNGCAPINLFGVGNVSPAAINYVMGTLDVATDIEQTAAAFTLRGEPVSLPAGPVALAVGGEYRRETAAVQSDPIAQAQGFFAINTQAWSGGLRVFEGFAEVGVPLLKDMPLVQALDANFALRVTDYSTSGTVTTWKAGAVYDIVEGLRLRAVRSRDIRAPSLSELFNRGTSNSLTVIDPLTRTSVAVRNTATGNPNLEAEKADTLTFGVVFSPTFVPGLRLSVDYFDIDVNGAINTLSPTDIVNGCFGTLPGLCSLLTRENGILTRVSTAPVNLQSLKTSGFDIEATWRLNLADVSSAAAGSLTFRALATNVQILTIATPSGSKKFAGTVTQPSIESIGGQPKWRANAFVTYENGPLSVSLTERYVGGGKADSTFTARDLDVLEANSRLYTDISASYELKAMGADVELFGVVENLFDKDPPILVTGSFPTPRALYDTIGRRFTLGARMRF